MWSANNGVSIILPTDHVDGDGRNYIVIGEDVPTEVASQYTAALVFHNGSFDPNNPDGMFPNGFVYSIIGFSTKGALEITMYYYIVSAPTGGGFQYYRQTVLSVSPPIGSDNSPVLSLGENPNYGSYNEGSLQAIEPRAPRTLVGAAGGWSSPSGEPFHVYADLQGIVHCGGWLSNTNTFTPAGGELLAQIPSPFRPTEPKFFSIPVSIGASTSIQVNINTDGTIKIARPSTLSIGAGAVWGFDHCKWRVGQ